VKRIVTTTKIPGKNAAVYDRLLDEILSCRLPPGSQIFEQDLANRFGMSKSPVREALQRLRQQGLVDVKARSGYRVSPISLTQVNEMYDMRFMYESTCALLAIAHASEADIARLDAFHSAPMYTSITKWTALNRRFHMELAGICGNNRLAETAAEFIAQFDRFTHVGVSRLAQPLRLDGFVEEHAAIVEAIRKRDRRRVQSILKSHIESSRRRALEVFSHPPIVP
jgi:GntR family transcriptional regulator, rspAB operon transcriptional repressor